MSAVKTLVDGKISGNKVMVFSKSYCPFCTKAKKALESLNLGSDLEVMEIENRSDCDEIQDYLLKVTGGRSIAEIKDAWGKNLCAKNGKMLVPRVFINGKFIGGGDETVALAKDGKLEALIKG